MAYQVVQVEKESQNLQIFRALNHGATITPKDALSMCGCFRLSARIANLKDLGCVIVNDSPGGAYAQYRLIGFEHTDAEAVEARLKRGRGRA